MTSTRTARTFRATLRRALTVNLTVFALLATVAAIYFSAHSTLQTDRPVSPIVTARNTGGWR